MKIFDGVTNRSTVTIRVLFVGPGADGKGEEDPDRRQEQTDRALHHGSAHVIVQGEAFLSFSQQAAQAQREKPVTNDLARRLICLSKELIGVLFM